MVTEIVRKCYAGQSKVIFHINNKGKNKGFRLFSPICLIHLTLYKQLITFFPIAAKHSDWGSFPWLKPNQDFLEIFFTLKSVQFYNKVIVELLVKWQIAPDNTGVHLIQRNLNLLCCLKNKFDKQNKETTSVKVDDNFSATASEINLDVSDEFMQVLFIPCASITAKAI